MYPRSSDAQGGFKTTDKLKAFYLQAAAEIQKFPGRGVALRLCPFKMYLAKFKEEKNYV